jgi:hypothetical protein
MSLLFNCIDVLWEYNTEAKNITLCLTAKFILLKMKHVGRYYVLAKCVLLLHLKV